LARGFAAFCAALIAAAGSASAAPTFTVLHAFTGGDGRYPQAGLVLDSNGNLYGTTRQGGPACGPGGFSFGCGVVFKITPGGAYGVLHYFCSQPECRDGFFPAARLIADSQGNLYGTTTRDGTMTRGDGGLVFKLSPGGTETVLHDFCPASPCSGGSHPEADLIADSNRNLYGTTPDGGAGCRNGPLGCGVVFRLSPDGTYKVLHSFTGGDGAYPMAGLLLDSNRNLYGTTPEGGGGTECGGGCGTVFKLSPPSIPGGAWTEKVLYSFTSKGRSLGAFPTAGLITDRAGNLYGTTGGGGAICGPFGTGCGVAFKLSRPAPPSTKWTYTVLHFFTDLGNSALIADRAGNLYGTSGTVVFRLSPPLLRQRNGLIQCCTPSQEWLPLAA
jgi:uncharacterized repeat protein (TIGR03803 family)